MDVRVDLRQPSCTTELADLVNSHRALITWPLHDGKGGGGGIGRTEKAAKLSDLVDFGKRKILPCVFFPDKELCVQTAIVK